MSTGSVLSGRGWPVARRLGQCARCGVEVELFEMRPVRKTPAHQTADSAELVCFGRIYVESSYARLFKKTALSDDSTSRGVSCEAVDPGCAIGMHGDVGGLPAGGL